MKDRMIVVGSVALDSIQTPFGKINRGVGGSSVYSSLAASFFTDVSIIGVVGKDFPEDFLKKMRKRGISTDGIKRVPGKTFFWRGDFGKYNRRIRYRHDKNLCDNCQNKKDFDAIDDSIFVCIKCYAQKTIIKQESSFKDSDRVNISAKYKYERRVHFRDCVNQYQGNCILWSPSVVFWISSWFNLSIYRHMEKYNIIITQNN